MGMAAIAHVLFTRYVVKEREESSSHSHFSFFNANPKNSKWFNRDRFVLSNGYALSALMFCASANKRVV